MANTVVSVYDDIYMAQQAKGSLLANGFLNKRVRIIQGDTAAMMAEGANPSIGGRIVHFFSSLFGADQWRQRAGKRAEAVYRGGAVVTVDTTDTAEAKRAQAILAQYRPIENEARPGQ